MGSKRNRNHARQPARQPQEAGDVTPEALEALTVLAAERLMVLYVPASASDEFVKRLTTFTSFCLDTKLLPPMLVPAVRVGDGLHCPYCAAPIKAEFKHQLEPHDEDCEWRLAMTRWAFTQGQIDKEAAG